MKTFLHVGCGPKRKNQTTKGFNTPEWNELRLDIDASVAPDLQEVWRRTTSTWRTAVALPSRC